MKKRTRALSSTPKLVRMMLSAAAGETDSKACHPGMIIRPIELNLEEDTGEYTIRILKPCYLVSKK